MAAKPTSSRKLPRPFEMPWGKGMIVEEVSIMCEHHEPCIQLMEFEEGYEEIRFCYYDLNGRYQRSSMLISPDELKKLAKQLKRAPRLAKMLRAFAI